MTRLLAILAGTAVLGAVVVTAVVYLITGAGPVPPATVDFATLDDTTRGELVEKGRAVARAADCAACHNSPEGAENVGGLEFETPFGTLYGTNITPSKTDGIGDWSADDLYRAMVYGIGLEGRRLYPAMPYTSYHYTTRADVDALWVYLMSRPVFDRPNRPTEMMFPFSFRPMMSFWNLLFRPRDTELPVVAQQSEAWYRGRYLVDVLGHCGECHTPRNLLFAMTDRHLQGAIIEGTEAPDITPDGLKTRGWTGADLKAFFSEGLSRQGVMLFRMFPVLVHSSQYLDDADRGAVITYLMGADAAADMNGASGWTPMGQTAHSDGSVPNSGAVTPEAESGRDLYVGLCAGCHGVDGEGQPFGSPPMDTNTSAMLADPLNLVRAIRDGVGAHKLPGTGRMQAMPAFGERLDDQQMADLVNYMRTTWGGQPADVSAQQIGMITSAH